MLSQLSLKWSTPPRVAPSVPDGRRVYVIGDVHGCRQLLEKIAMEIERDLIARPPLQSIAILLGDYIDRGPDSAGVLAMLAGGHMPLPFMALRGNHEQMLLNFLEDAAFLEVWRHFGGLETLHSFGIDVEKARQTSSFSEVQRHLKAAFPPTTLRFVAQLPLSCEAGDYYFCHAGIRPGVPLTQQRDEDLLNVRETFLQCRGDYGKVIVHGHTPVEQPDVRPNRINIDTGAYLTGTLTCLVLEQDARRFLST